MGRPEGEGQGVKNAFGENEQALEHKEEQRESELEGQQEKQVDCDREEGS